MPLPPPTVRDTERRVPLCGAVAACVLGVDANIAPEELEKVAGSRAQRAVRVDHGSKGLPPTCQWLPPTTPAPSSP
jgi:hypothetical protein